MGACYRSLTLITLPYVLSDSSHFALPSNPVIQVIHLTVIFQNHAGFERQSWKWNSKWLSTLFSLMPPISELVGFSVDILASEKSQHDLPGYWF